MNGPHGLVGGVVVAAIAMLLVVLVRIALRRRPRGVRVAVDVAGSALLVLVGIGEIALAARMARLPDAPPLPLTTLRATALATFIEAFFVIAFVWLPWLMDRFEDVGGALLVAVRQVRSRKSGFLTVISFLAFFGVGLSSCGLCSTISVMGGFGNDLKHKILGNNAHVVIDHDRDGFLEWRPVLAAIRAIPGVSTATPLVQGEVMITSQTNLSGVILRGIDPAERGSAGRLGESLVRGRLDYLSHPDRLLDLTLEERRPITSRDDAAPVSTPLPATPRAPGAPQLAIDDGSSDAPGEVLPGVVIGRELASNLHLAVGDEVRIVSPFGGMLTPAGPLPKTRMFRVAGIFYSGMYEYDTKYAYLSIAVAQDFFNYVGDRITSIEVRVDDVDSADVIAARVQPLVAARGMRVRDWKQLNQNLFRALGLEKLLMFVLLGVAIVVASFAIVATLLLLVIEKGREIAVLKAMGASDPFIARVFMLVGLLIGVIGSVLGVGLALLVCTMIQRLGFPLDPEVYYINELPVFISLSDYAFVMLIAIMVCLVATLYPAWAASRLRPVEGMRFG